MKRCTSESPATQTEETAPVVVSEEKSGSTLVVETQTAAPAVEVEDAQQRQKRSLDEEFAHWGGQFEKAKNRIRFLMGSKELVKIAKPEGLARVKLDKLGRDPQTLESLKAATQAAWNVISEWDEQSLKEVVEPVMQSYDSLSYDERVAAFKALASLRKRLAINRGHRYEPPTAREAPGLSPALYEAVKQQIYGISDPDLKKIIMNLQGTMEIIQEAEILAAGLAAEYSGESQGAPIAEILGEEEASEVVAKIRGRRRGESGDN